MKVLATSGGVITKVCIEIGQMVSESENLFSYELQETPSLNEQASDSHDLTYIRPDLAETIERHEIGRDHRRKSAVEKAPHKGTENSKRKNIADLTDGGELTEYRSISYRSATQATISGGSHFEYPRRWYGWWPC